MDFLGGLILFVALRVWSLRCKVNLGEQSFCSHFSFFCVRSFLLIVKMRVFSLKIHRAISFAFVSRLEGAMPGASSYELADY